MLPLEHFAHSNNVCFHFYADDSQIYLSCDLVNDLSEINTFINCFEDALKWMSQNVMQLNTNKTDVLIIAPYVVSWFSVFDCNLDTVIHALITSCLDNHSALFTDFRKKSP